MKEGFPSKLAFGGTELGEFLPDLFKLFAFFYLDKFFEEEKIFFIQSQTFLSVFFGLPEAARGAV